MTNFIGRKEELNMINRFCSGEESRLLFVCGENGVGKTSLLNEFAKSASDKHWVFRFKPEQNESPHSYIFQWLNDFLTGRTFFKGAEAWKDIMQNEVKVIDFIKMALVFDKASMGFRVVELLERVTSLFSNDRRLVIIIDPDRDLQGQHNIEFIEYLAKKVSTKIRVIVAQSDNAILELVKGEKISSLCLSGFSEEETTDMIATSDLFNEENQYLSQKVFEKSSGNVLYIESCLELLKQTIKDRKVVDTDIEKLPDGLAVLMHSIYMLNQDKDNLEVIYWVSIIPGVIDYDILSFLTSFSLEKIEHILNCEYVKLIISTEKIEAGVVVKPVHQSIFEIVMKEHSGRENEVSSRYKRLSGYYLKKTLKNETDFDSLMYYNLCLLRSKDKEVFIRAARGLVDKFYAFLLRDSCIEILERVIAFSKETKAGVDDYVEFIRQAGIICHEQKHIEKALDLFNEAIAIYRTTKNRDGEASVSGNIGIVYRDIFETGKAFEFLQASLDVYTEIGDKIGQSNILTQMWKIDYEMSNFDRAIEYLLKLLVLTKEIGDVGKLMTIFGNIGNLYCGSGDFDKAVIYYEQALNVSEMLNDNQKIATFLSRIGISYLYSGLHLEALEYFINSLKLHQQLSNMQEEAVQFGNIGIAYKKIGDLDKALEYFSTALKIFTRRGAVKHIKLMKRNIDSIKKINDEKENQNE